MVFLYGKTALVTAESFRSDDNDGSYDCLYYGTYTYADLKATMDSYAGEETIASYALADMGQDGQNELVLRFNASETTDINWIGVIHKNGFDTEMFTQNDLYGYYVTDIVTDLGRDWSELPEDYTDFLSGEGFLVREHRTAGAVKIAVYSWDTDPVTYQKEKSLIDTLVSFGAQMISTSEMDKLCDFSAYTSTGANTLQIPGRSRGKTEKKTDVPKQAYLSSFRFISSSIHHGSTNLLWLVAKPS